MRNHMIFAAAAAAILVGGSAQAAVVYNTTLDPLVGGTTTTDATGTRSTNTVGGSLFELPFQSEQWNANNVRLGSTVGITTDYARSGNGSAFFSTASTTSKADLEYYFAAPVALSSFQGASFDWYRDGASTAAAHLAPVIRFITTGPFSNLVYEQVYQPGEIFGDNVWHTDTVSLSSTIFASNGALNEPAGTGGCPGCYASLGDWIAANPGLKVQGVSIGVGSGWAGTFRGGVDNVRFSFNEKTYSSNFEVAAAAVPEPTGWAMMITGFGMMGAMMRRRRLAPLKA